MSAAEVKVGIALGLIDPWPMAHTLRPVGTWEQEGCRQVAKPGLWEGLL